MTTAEDHLSALPESIQAQLWQVTRSVMGMSRDERITTLEVLVGVAEAFLAHGGNQHVPALQTIDALGGVIREVDTAGFPRNEKGA